jgi:hypothetical protein
MVVAREPDIATTDHYSLGVGTDVVGGFDGSVDGADAVELVLERLHHPDGLTVNRHPFYSA